MTDGKINLMVLIVSMPVGGVESQVLSVVQRLNREKYHVTICCIKEPGTLGEKASDKGIKVISLGLMKSSRFSFSIPLRISGVLKENKIDILWTHQYVANLYGRIAALLSGTKGITSTYHALYDKPKKHRSIFNHFLSYRTDALAAVSRAVAEDMKSFDHVSPGKVSIIHNGIDIPFFDINETQAECRKKLGLPEEEILIGAVGRLSEEKNHKVMIEAVNMLPEKVKGVIVGDGKLEGPLREAGGKRIYFLTKMEHALLPYALKAMDIFCFPSLWEGFGLALVEAMAAGLPPVSSDIPTLREVAGEGALYFPSDSAVELANILKSLIDDPAERKLLGDKARKRAAVFSIDNTVKAYENLFAEIEKRKIRSHAS